MKKLLFSLVIVCLSTMVMALAMAADAGSAAKKEATKGGSHASTEGAKAPAATKKEAVTQKAPQQQQQQKQQQQKAAQEKATKAEAALKPVPLSNQDCVKCHFAIVKELDAHGEAHKEVNCLGCHEEHPPEGTNVIPSCSDCHDPSESEHFGVKGCTSCHNPHEPLLVDFTKAKEAKPACLTCHQDKGEEMKAHPSAHSEQDCNNCHYQHGLGKGQYQTCLDCHEGHSPDMKVADCLKCHRPHSPTNITYGDDIPVPLCASCHDKIAVTLAKSGTKHAEMTCVECHDSRHGKITPCVECHDLPHDKYIHDKFPKCLTCHRDPHNLAK